MLWKMMPGSVGLPLPDVQVGIVKVKLLPRQPAGFTSVLFCQVQHLQYWSFYSPQRVGESQKCCIVCCTVCIIIRMSMVVKERL